MNETIFLNRIIEIEDYINQLKNFLNISNFKEKSNTRIDKKIKLLEREKRLICYFLNKQIPK